MRYHLTIREHEELGNTGFTLDTAPWTDPVGGMGCAHDILEHFPGDTGTMEEEMMALGAMLLVRGETYLGFTNNRYSLAENVASDFPNFNHHFVQAGRTGRLRFPGITHKLRDAEHLEDIISDALREIHAQFLDEDLPLPSWVRDRDIRGWMRRGYRRAVHRYRHVHAPAYSLPSAFFGLERALDQRLMHAELGDRFTVDLHLPKCTWSINQVDDEDDY